MKLYVGNQPPDTLLEARRRGDAAPRTIRLSDYRGRWIVLFANSRESAFYDALRREFGGVNAIVIGVSRDADARYAYPVIVDQAAALGLDENTTAIIGPDGVVRHLSCDETAARTLSVLRSLRSPRRQARNRVLRWRLA
jgi:alkyl hydroperoxide reductase subunit AhpC